MAPATTANGADMATLGPPPAAAAEAAEVFDEDWEEFDPARGVQFSYHMMAGSCAGMMEHVVMFPVDTLKVRGEGTPTRNT